MLPENKAQFTCIERPFYEVADLPEEMEYVAGLVNIQLFERPAWMANNTIDVIASSFVEEKGEYNQAIAAHESPYETTGDQKLLNILAEAGDLGYYAITYFLVSNGSVSEEMIESLHEANEMVISLTNGRWNMATCTLMKVVRNALKYAPDLLVEEKNYPTTRKNIQTLWDELLGDIPFINRYVESFNGRDETGVEALQLTGQWWQELAPGRDDEFIWYHTIYSMVQRQMSSRLKKSEV